MRRLITVAMSAGVILAGTGGLAAQGRLATPTRPFSNMFTNPAPAPEVPPALTDGLRKALRNELRARTRMLSDPSRTKCHMIVIPADPTIDPHFSVSPPSTTRFLMHEERTDHLCR
jgi:hypothetical protein